MIYAPIGGFGNHLRWLLLLDENYTIKLKDQVLITSNEKLEFIKKFVYCEERSWHNWIKFEFRYRIILDQYLKFTHDMTDIFDDLKTVGLTIDPELAYKSYVKFNPTLNGISKNSFLQQIQKQNKMCKFANDYSPDLFYCVDSASFFQPTLDIKIYNNIINYFNLQSHNDVAQEIHYIWYNLHLKSAAEWEKYNNSIQLNSSL